MRGPPRRRVSRPPSRESEIGFISRRRNAARLLHERAPMSGAVTRRWSLSKGAFLGLALSRCAQGENLGIDKAPPFEAPPEMVGTSAGGSAGAQAIPSGSGGGGA